MIKNIFKNLITTILRAEARLILAKYKPKLVGVTGSVGKTGTKDAAAAALGAVVSVGKSQKSYNSDLGVPLAIIGGESGWLNPIVWLMNMLKALELIILPCKYPTWLVLEVGADRPGDIRRLASWLRFQVVVLTAIPEVPPHIEFFKSLQELIDEKASIVDGLVPGGTIVINADDTHVAALIPRFKERIVGTHSRIITYGFSDQAELKASNAQILYDNDQPDGITFKLDYEGHSLPVRIKGVFGLHHVYGALAALGVGVSQDFNLVALAEGLLNHETPPGRLKLIEGIKNTNILDDTYNSSPQALTAALATLAEIKVPGRKIAVLGDMLELGEYTIDAHREAGKEAAKVCDLLITIGMRAKFIYEAAGKAGMGKKKLQHFDTAQEAGEALEQLIEPGDLILVKGSQGVRLEKVVEEIMLHPELKSKLLTRQYEQWVK